VGAAAERDIDPITLEVVRNKLDGIANEMEMTLVRSAFSIIVKEALDASASIFTPEGEPLAQSLAIPAHLTMLVPMVRTILKTFPVATMQVGDLYVLNDPYDGASHLPDISIIMPVFHDGRLIAFTAALTHHQDLGGMTPASVPTNATEIFQEGFRIPPLRLRCGGRYDETLLALLRQNVRLPAVFSGDLNAQIACCSIGARRLGELAAQYGGNHLAALFDELLERSERMIRDALRQLPEGTYRYTNWLDNDGVELDRRLKIEVAVTIKDGTILFDFEGTSPQARGPINAVPAGAFGAGCFGVRAVSDPRIPNNGGCFRPMQFKLPQGSLVNPIEPAPVSCRSVTLKALAGCVLGALRQAAPDRIPADPSGELVLVHFGGARPDGARFITSQLLAGGTGAGPQDDGTDVIETDMTNCMNVPAEALEMEAPLRVHSLRLAADSGGAGRQRGGLGCIQEFEMLVDDVAMTYRGERHFFAPPGFAGGGDGGRASAVIHRAGGGTEAIPSKIVARLMKGDRLVIQTAGGAGYGDPAERPRALVAEDLANGKITADEAHRAYPQAQL
jgi:N-methylhydantoinase B